MLSDASEQTRPGGAAGRRERDFRLFWLGGAANLLGSNASELAMPILVLALGGSALTAGAVGTVGAAVQVLLTPVCGVYADRGSRRALMTGALAVAALATGAVAIGAATKDLPLVFACVVLVGAATAAYGAAATASIRALLPEHEPEKAIASLQAREQGAKLAGPGIGGALYQIAAWVPFLVDAVSFLFAAVCARAIRADLRPRSEAPGAADGTAGVSADGTAGIATDAETGGAQAPATAQTTAQSKAQTKAQTKAQSKAPETPGFRTEFAAGAAFLWRHPFLRFVTLWAGGVNLLVGALSFAVIVSARLDGSAAGGIGVVMTLAGAAGLLGALLAPRLLRRVRAVHVVRGASWAMAAAVVPMIVKPSLAADAVALVLLGLLAPSLSIIFQSKAVMAIPDTLQGRVGTALGTLAEGTGAVAPFAAGVLVKVLHPSVLAGALTAGLALLALYATLSVPLLRSDPAGAGSGAASGQPHAASPEPSPVPVEG